MAHPGNEALTVLYQSLSGSSETHPVGNIAPRAGSVYVLYPIHSIHSPQLRPPFRFWDCLSMSALHHPPRRGRVVAIGGSWHCTMPCPPDIARRVKTMTLCDMPCMMMTLSLSLSSGASVYFNIIIKNSSIITIRLTTKPCHADTAMPVNHVPPLLGPGPSPIYTRSYTLEHGGLVLSCLSLVSSTILSSRSLPSSGHTAGCCCSRAPRTCGARTPGSLHGKQGYTKTHHVILPSGSAASGYLRGLFEALGARQ